MITIENLSKNYGARRILSEVNLKLPDGKILFIMGENGSGKTTFIKCLMDMESYSGDIKFDDNPVDKVRDSCFVLFDDCPFYDKMSGIQNLMLLSENLKKKKEIRTIGEKYLDYDTLKLRVGYYSNGQRKKLGIALIDCLMPKYIILDEISNGLDYISLKQLKTKIIEWSKNSTIIMTGHQFDFYNNLIDELYILKDEKISKEEGYEKGVDRLEDIFDEKMC